MTELVILTIHLVVPEFDKGESIKAILEVAERYSIGEVKAEIVNV